MNKIDEEHYADCQHIERLQDYKSKKNDIENIKDFLERYHRDVGTRNNNIIIGGCCGYGVEEMRELMEELNLKKSLSHE